MFTDSHCHLASGQFKQDSGEVIQRALEKGITRMVTVGTDCEDSAECIELASRHPSVFAAAGIHPCSVTEIIDDDQAMATIHNLATSPKVAAIGEIGLDYFHPAPDGWAEEAYRQRQADFFRAQLELAAELRLNVIIHQRDRESQCWNDILRIMEPFHGRLRAVFHCFSHSWASAKPLVEQGHLISFTGIATFPNAKEIHQCATEANDDAFMLETDSPYLAPVPHRGKRCEPSHTLHTGEFIAALRGTTVEQLARATEKNAESFFRLGH